LASDIKVGIVGAAGRGSAFFSAFDDNPLCAVTAVCDLNEERLAQTAAENHIEQVYTDYAEMLDRSGVDAVVVGTPMHLHASQSIMALKRGIHVLSEVTAAISIEECRQLAKAARESRATYMMAENCCYFRQNVIVREITRAGLFGELYLGSGEYVHAVSSLNEPHMWRRRWHTGINGNTYCTHSLGPVYQWFGGQRVTSVCCFGSGNHYRDLEGKPFENEDSTFTACRLEGGGLVNLRLDMLSNRPTSGNCYMLQGTQGCYESGRGFGDKDRIHLSDRHEPEQWQALDELAEEFLPDHWLKLPQAALASGHFGSDYMVAADFINSVANSTPPPIGIHETLDLTLTGLASQESIARGSVWVDVPDSREF